MAIPLQQSLKTIIGRGYQLFIEIPLAVQTGYDMDAKMQQHFNMTPLQFMLTGYAMWILANGTVDYQMMVEIPALQNLVTATSQRNFLQLSSGTAADYRKEIRGEDWKKVNKLKEIYGLDPFVKIPAIAVQHSSHLSSTSYVVPQARYYLDRASSGIFYLLGDKEMEVAHPKGNPFRIAFGIIYREYVGRQLAQTGKQVFIDLDMTPPVGWTKKLPDFVLVDGDTCLIVEVKTTLLGLNARSLFEDDVLLKETKSGSIQKAIDQTNVFREAILRGELGDARFAGITKVVNLIVGYEDIFTLNATIVPVVATLYPDASQHTQWGCISDIEAMGSAIYQQKLIVTLLIEKMADLETRTHSIATYLQRSTDSANPIIDAAYEKFQRRLITV